MAFVCVMFVSVWCVIIMFVLPIDRQAVEIKADFTAESDTRSYPSALLPSWWVIVFVRYLVLTPCTLHNRNPKRCMGHGHVVLVVYDTWSCKYGTRALLLLAPLTRRLASTAFVCCTS